MFRLQTERLFILSHLLAAVGGAYRRSVSATEEDKLGIGSAAHVDVLVNLLNNHFTSTAQVACCGLMQIVNNGPLAVKHLIKPHHIDAFLARGKSPRPVWRCAMLDLLGALPPHRLKEAQRLFLLASLGDPTREVRHVAASLLVRRGRGLASYIYLGKMSNASTQATASAQAPYPSPASVRASFSSPSSSIPKTDVPPAVAAAAAAAATAGVLCITSTYVRTMIDLLDDPSLSVRRMGVTLIFELITSITNPPLQPEEAREQQQQQHQHQHQHQQQNVLFLEEALPRLINKLHHPMIGTRLIAVEVLTRMSPPSLYPSLAKSFSQN